MVAEYLRRSNVWVTSGWVTLSGTGLEGRMVLDTVLTTFVGESWAEKWRRKGLSLANMTRHVHRNERGGPMANKAVRAPEPPAIKPFLGDKKVANLN